jgi:hypothetical protein
LPFVVVDQAKDLGELKEWRSAVSGKLDDLIRDNEAMRQALCLSSCDSPFVRRRRYGFLMRIVVLGAGRMSRR